MRTEKLRTVGYFLSCVALIFGLFGGLLGSTVAFAAQESSGDSISLLPNQEEPPPPEPEEEVELFSAWPVLEGQPGDSFKFDITFNYWIKERRVFDLNLTVPSGWVGSPLSGYPEREIEAFEPDPTKFTETLRVEVRPQQGVRIEPGEYVFTFEAASDELRGSVDLKAVIVARPLEYALDVVTLTGQANVLVKAGEDNHTALYVRNIATGDLGSTALTAEHPEGWSIIFTPGQIETLDSGQFTEVDVVITLPDNIEAGDYPVIVKANSGEIEGDLELRVTVLGTTSLAGVGIGVGIAVIAGLIIWFKRLGRR